MPGGRAPERGAIVVGLVVGCFLTWNVSNVGAAADPLADAYGVSLAVIGLLTTALFVTHLLSQLPAGIWSDRIGPHRVALAACASAAAGNAILLIDDEIALGIVGRLVVGVGSGAGFVAGLDLVRAGRGGPVMQGVYGGATMAGGGLALVVVPPLTDATGWRATYVAALVLAVAAAVPTALVRGLRRVGPSGRGVLGDRRLLPLGVLQAATFGLAVIAGNWIVPLLERQDASSAIAGALGGLVLLAGIVTRPLGGGAVLAFGHRRALPGPRGGPSVRGDLRGGAAAAPRRAGGGDRVRQRVRRVRGARRDAARGPRLWAPRRRPDRIRGDRLSRGCRSAVRRTHPPDRPRWRQRRRPPILNDSHTMEDLHMPLSFGVTVLPDPPASRLVELMKLGEDNGFEIGWTYDSHVLWQESFVQLTMAIQATSRMKFGHLVTNPGTREPTVLASLYATMHDISDGRMVMGIGRGDSARRYIGQQPVKVAEFERRLQMIKPFMNGEEVHWNDKDLQLKWVRPELPRIPMWVAGYGPRALGVAGRIGDGVIIQLADPEIIQWIMGTARAAAEEAGRDPAELKCIVCAPSHVGPIEDGREQTRWFPAMVSNHVKDLIERYGTDGSVVPHALTDYVEKRKFYDYDEHSRVGAKHGEFVTDEICDRFSVLGDVGQISEKLRELESIGVDHYSIYLMTHNQEATLEAYGRKIIPQFAGAAA